MIRQAHTYLVSAMSGATLIAIAIAVFVVLVSAQVFRDWPIAALGAGGDGTAAVSDAHPAAASAAGAGGNAGSRPAAGPSRGQGGAGSGRNPGPGTRGRGPRGPRGGPRPPRPR